MVSFIQSLQEPLTALVKFPKLFVPKIVLAIIWGSLLLVIVDLFNKILLNPTNMETVSFVSSQLPSLIALTFIIFLIDVFVNAMYPLMVQDFFEKKQVSLLSSFKIVLQNAFSFLVPIIAAFIISMLLIFPFIFLFSLSIVFQNTSFIVFSLILALVAIFIVSVIFYFVFPVIVLEKKGISGIMRSIRVGKNHFREASFGVIITFVLSVLTAVIASFSGFASIQGMASIALFLLLRLLTAVSASYQIVLNPILYLEYIKGK